MPELIMRRFLQIATFLVLLLASCGTQPATVISTESTPIDPTPTTPTSIDHAPEIRFGLVGKLTDVNVWSLFDETGASYANYAVRNGYWPRLFTLSIPEREFAPLAARDIPTRVVQDGELYTATVNLRDDLKWTDGSAFTADDVVFTVQTALSFELTYDWKSSYDPAYIDHAETVDAHTVKFYFKQKPNVATWQYGALMAPIAQKAYWDSKISGPAALLPDEELRTEIINGQAEIQLLQNAVAEINALMITLKKNGPDYRKAEADLKRNQGNLDGANNLMAELQSDYATRLYAARTALFALDDAAEPTLGTWMAGESQSNSITNTVNPSLPFGEPHFDRTVYKFYASENDAVAALQNGEVDSILSLNGVSPEVAQSLASNASVQIVMSQSNAVRFLSFNHSRFILSNPAFRSALDCVIDRNALVKKYLQGASMPLDSFVLSSAAYWYNADAKSQCTGMDEATRIQTAVGMLKSAGFSWTREPTTAESGQGFMMPEGKEYPEITLLAPSAEYDGQRAAAAEYIETQAHLLGIPLKMQLASPEEILYAVYSSGNYDMALLGWRLSEYPAYLCTWFQPWNANPFHYNENKPRSACEAFESATEIEDARAASFEVQSLFAKQLPMIPLYTTVTYDIYDHLNYSFIPFGGLTSLYGAPSMAVPAPQ